MTEKPETSVPWRHDDALILALAKEIKLLGQISTEYDERAFKVECQERRQLEHLSEQAFAASQTLQAAMYCLRAKDMPAVAVQLAVAISELDRCYPGPNKPLAEESHSRAYDLVYAALEAVQAASGTTAEDLVGDCFAEMRCRPHRWRDIDLSA